MTKNSCKKTQEGFSVERLSRDTKAARKQRVLSIDIELNGFNRPAIIDTGSNISCIDVSLLNGTENIKKEKGITITGADNTVLELLGVTNIQIKINNYSYLVHAYIIKGLSCKILLGNDFNITNKIVINFQEKQIILTENDNIINMDEIWYEYNKIGISSSVKNIASLEFNMGEKKCVVDKKIIAAPSLHIDLEINERGKTHLTGSIKKEKKESTEPIDIHNFNGLAIDVFSNKHCNMPSQLISTELFIKDAGTVETTTKDNTVDILLTNTKKPDDIYFNDEIRDAQNTIIKISNDLDYTQRKKAKQLINSYKHLFTSNPLDIGCANIEPCEIKLKSDKPIFQAPYRVSPTQREKLKGIINQMIESDIVEPSRSNYAAPVFLIPKKQKGEYRFLVDYRKLNDETVSDKHPIPRADDLFRALEGARFFSSMDMAQGYFQLPVRQQDREKTAFITDFGLFQFKKLMQGWKNSAPIFQRTINNIFSDYMYRTMIAYLDDICCFGKNFEESYDRLEQIFERLEEAGLKLRTDKCFFFNSQIDLLGQKVSKDGLMPLEKNIEAIINFPIPQKVKDVRAFVGLTSYYRRYIRNFAKIAGPLTGLTKKENTFYWGKEQDRAFEILKQAIISAPVLAHFEEGLPIFVTTDASLEGLAGILEQESIEGKRHPIAYASRKLKGGEKNYSTTELEMSAVVFAVNYFREYLIGRKITVFSDHSSLQFYKTMKNPSSRITKFIFKLLEFDLEIKHKPGSWNQAADCLSRYPIEVFNIKTILEEENNDNVDFSTIDLNILKDKQLEDEICGGIILAIKGDDNSKYKKKSRQYCIKDDLLFYKNWSPQKINYRLVIPKSLINLVLKSYHESVFSGHFGVLKTLARLKTKYYWRTMIQDTNKFIKSCRSCQLLKNPIGKKPGLLQPIPLESTKPINRLCVDYLGPLPPSKGKKYLIVATCNSTKMVFAKAVANADGAATIDFLLDIITTFGTPKYLVSDRGTHFKNKEVGIVCEKLGIKQGFSTSYHPQSQGSTELMNKIICNCLTHYVHGNQKLWASYYKMVVFAYNTHPHSRLGYSPYYLMFGVEATQPLENKIWPEDTNFDRIESLKHLQSIRESIPILIEKEQLIQKEYYDKTHKMVNYLPGQRVLVKFDIQKPGQSKKLAYKYRGPFEVIKKMSEVNYKIALTINGKDTVDTIHVQRLKPYH